jgi:steroid delta-isomerase-like uncharacterized protein
MTRTAIVALAVALGAAAGCAHSTPNGSTNMSEQIREQNKRDVRALFEAFNRGDLGRVAELVGPEYVGAQGEKGPAGFNAVVIGLRTAFPDLRYTLDDVIAEGDQVAVRWHWTGTHEAPFRAFPATGKSVSNTGAGIFHLRAGKIVAATLETDRLGFLEQLGAVPEGVGRGPKPNPPAAGAAATGAGSRP